MNATHILGALMGEYSQWRIMGIYFPFLKFFSKNNPCPLDYIYIYIYILTKSVTRFLFQKKIKGGRHAPITLRQNGRSHVKREIEDKQSISAKLFPFCF